MNAVLTKHSDAAPTGEATVTGLTIRPPVSLPRREGTIRMLNAKQFSTRLVKPLFYLIVLFIHTPLFRDA